METISNHSVKFGELFGPVIHGSAIFDWHLWSTQQFADMQGYTFQELMNNNEIPYAPVSIAAKIFQYPTIGDRISVEAMPINVGESSITLAHMIYTASDKKIGELKSTHVTISPDNTAKNLPEEVRSALAEDTVNYDSPIQVYEEYDKVTADYIFSDQFNIQSSHIEGSKLAYFEEYPRFLYTALERFISSHGREPEETRYGEKPHNLSKWAWRFQAPVPYRSRLALECKIEKQDDTCRVSHEMHVDGKKCIVGFSDFTRFNGDGHPVSGDPFPMI